MIIGGKLIGAILGFISYGPPGLILGLLFGHIFDRGLDRILHAPKHTNAVRLVFFKTVFEVMGYLAKADGVVSEEEIGVARKIMLHDFKLDKNQMLMAIGFFNDGKKASFDLASAINKFRVTCGKYTELRKFFLELLVKASLADGSLGKEKRVKLTFICNSLGIQLSELDYQLRSYGYSASNRAYTQQQYNTNRGYNYTTSGSKHKDSDQLTNAYDVLGVKATDNSKIIKNAYRRLMSKYHPDKLVAKGLPPEMLELAKEKTQQISAAYDLIMRSRI